jgi:uncharacterized protein (DUF697 family)
MFSTLRSIFSPAAREAELTRHLEQLRQRQPVPVPWLLGKTQSGKTSIIRYITGAADAQIGQGFRPCTRFSRRYPFPTAEAPLVTFLDTRGLEEPGYDPQEDLEASGKEAHLLIITVKALDHAQEKVIEALRVIRQATPTRPVLLALTCLHEGYPQEQHPTPYPYDHPEQTMAVVPPDLRRSIEEQTRRFEGLVDRVVPIDLTPAEEGFTEPHYGGEQLRQALLDLLPDVYRQTLVTLDQSTRELRDLFERMAEPYIIAYSGLAATAGAFPVPWIDLFILPGIQTRMVHNLAEIYGQPLNAQRFMELAGSLGIGLIVRQAVREVTKFIPIVGSVASGALAGASTFALGKAFCFYYSAVHQGHVPKAKDLKRYYHEQLSEAKKQWGRGEQGASAPGNGQAGGTT